MQLHLPLRRRQARLLAIQLSPSAVCQAIAIVHCTDAEPPMIGGVADDGPRNQKRAPVFMLVGRTFGKIMMTDEEDWRRRKVEELGRADTSPWLSPPPRATSAGGASAPQDGSIVDRKPAPVRNPSDIPSDAVHLDRSRAHPGTRAAQSKASAASSSPRSAVNRWGMRATGMLALLAGLALALVFGWCLRDAYAPDDTATVAPTTAAPSSAIIEPALGPAPTSPDAGPESMTDPVPDPTQSRSSGSAIRPNFESTLAAEPASPATSQVLPAAQGTERSPTTAQIRGEDSARISVKGGESAALRPARLGQSRGRFTAPRAVAAPGQDFMPSFDCRRATSWVNRMVCNDEELAALDLRMSNAYGDAVAVAGPARERRIDADQARFLGQRARCRTTACVDRAYRIRIDELAPRG